MTTFEWQPLSSAETDVRARDRAPGAPSLFDAVEGVVPLDSRSDEAKAVSRAEHLERYEMDEGYRSRCRLVKEIAHAYVETDGETTRKFYEQQRVTISTSRVRTSASVVPAVVPRPRARRRRSGAGKRTKAGTSDDGSGSSIVSLSFAAEDDPVVLDTVAQVLARIWGGLR